MEAVPAKPPVAASGPLFASRLQAVVRLNGPSARARAKKAKASGPAGKPLRKAEPKALKRRPEPKMTGPISSRRKKSQVRQTAEVIDLAAVRQARFEAA